MDLLAEQPLLLLFVVAAVGTLLGHIHVAGVGLGPAAVLFAGLLAGGLDGRLVLPELVQQLGLVLFVYTIGLSSGPAFFCRSGAAWGPRRDLGGLVADPAGAVGWRSWSPVGVATC